VPRRLENDRWLFGVTLALCLLGAVMIYSASAVTADQLYGRSYIFLLRQAAWLLLASRDVRVDADGLSAACASPLSCIQRFSWSC